MSKKVFALFLILTMCLTLAACSSTPPPVTGPGTDTNDEPGQTAGDGPEAAGDLAYVQERGSIIIGYTVYAPMNYTDEGGDFTGFDTELARIVCGILDLEADFVEINWNTKEIELATKNIDCIWNGLTITEERKQNMEITIPYVKNAQVVVMKADAEYTDTSSLIGKTVCAEAGSAGEKTIQEDENLQNADYIAKSVQSACLMEVAAGTADAAVLDLTLAKVATGEGTNYVDLVIKDRLAEEDYGVAFRKGSDLCNAVNEIFRELAINGTLEALANKYGLDLS